MAVPTSEGAAPPAAVGLCLVGEPEHAGLIFTTLDKAKVGRSQQNGCGFGDWRQDALSRVRLLYSLDDQHARSSPHQSRTSLCMIKKAVEQRRISVQSGLSFLYKRNDILP